MPKSQPSSRLTSSMQLAVGVGLAAVMAAATSASAANATMTAGDGFGTSSFNTAGMWDTASAPAAGNDYFNGAFLLRTPADAGSYTFGGDSLTITGGGLAAGVNNEALMWKGSGVGAIITVNNLIVNGGQLRHGQGDGDSFTLAGNISVGPNGANFATQGGMLIAAAISGSSTIRVLDNGNGAAARTITLTSGVNTFNGNIEMFGSAANRARLTLADDANLNFLIGANGINNSLFGNGTAIFNGDFTLDLSGAGSTVGDMWSLASVASQSFGSTFTVAGATDLGSGYWATAANGGFYIFNQGDAVLEFANTVPEPGSATLLLAGVGMLLGSRRARKA